MKTNMCVAPGARPACSCEVPPGPPVPGSRLHFWNKGQRGMKKVPSSDRMMLTSSPTPSCFDYTRITEQESTTRITERGKGQAPSGALTNSLLLNSSHPPPPTRRPCFLSFNSSRDMARPGMSCHKHFLPPHLSPRLPGGAQPGALGVSPPTSQHAAPLPSGFEGDGHSFFSSVCFSSARSICSL